MPAKAYSTLEVAQRLGVGVQTVQRWVDMGRLRAWRTVGGHRRIDAQDAERMFAELECTHCMSPDQPAQPAAVQQASKVLVVDDQPSDLELMSCLVMTLMPSATIIQAANGFEGLMALGAQAPDVLITDLVMPHMSGVEMLRQVCCTQGHSPATVIAMSAYTPLELRDLGALPAAVTLLRKPVDPVLLAHALHSVPLAEARP